MRLRCKTDEPLRPLDFLAGYCAPGHELQAGEITVELKISEHHVHLCIMQYSR